MRPKLMGDSSISRVQRLYRFLMSMIFLLSVSNGNRPRTTSRNKKVSSRLSRTTQAE